MTVACLAASFFTSAWTPLSISGLSIQFFNFHTVFQWTNAPLEICCFLVHLFVFSASLFYPHSWTQMDYLINSLSQILYLALLSIEIFIPQSNTVDEIVLLHSINCIFLFQSLFEIYGRNRAQIFKNKYMMFHHGGMLFWFITSCIFFVVRFQLVFVEE